MRASNLYKDLDLHPGRPPQKDACSLTALDGLFLGLFILTFSEFSLLHLSQLYEICCIVAAITRKFKLHGVAAAYRALAVQTKAHLLAAPLSEGFFASLLLFDLQPVATQVTDARNFSLQPGCPFSAGLCKREEGSGTPFVGHRSRHMTTLTP